MLFKKNSQQVWELFKICIIQDETRKELMLNYSRITITKTSGTANLDVWLKTSRLEDFKGMVTL